MNIYFNQVLHAFSTMDIELLEDLLDPTIPYSDVPKELFLERLEKAFESFREEGDTYLTAQPGSCCNQSCNPDAIRTAYRFVGDKTRLYLDLRFITEMTDDFKDHHIKDIFCCSSIQCFQPLDWYANDLMFIFYDDEEVNFPKSPELLIHLEKKKEAMYELKSNSSQMTESELRSWLLRYQFSYDFFQTFPKWVHHYSWIFFLMDYNSYIEQLKKVELMTDPEFLEDIYRENTTSEESLIQKITTIEQILIELKLENLIWVWKNEDLYYFKEHDFHLVDGIFDEFAKLWAWFKPRQIELLEKYFAFTPKETEEYCSKEVDHDPIYTLSFHLDFRKKNQQNDVQVPFGLWSNKQPLPFWFED
ncbi:hypothetical protein [Algoriphagus persicinus]|uniref:hypothetical protein n=1 Tax=Algoriphagus persicinus TaxID=3108754 RepID=UPI002B36D1D0|nr:hypothetical protein [Algoriphagus sp. E1-3-M2]MEB2786302.1 hypothetical protein [Algoriphagus sp. E1-3-M2]